MEKVHGIEQGKKIRIFQDDFGRLFWCNKYIVYSAKKIKKSCYKKYFSPFFAYL